MSSLKLRLGLWGLLCLFFISILSTPSHQATNYPPNPRLSSAYKALQAWKQVILSDPKKITANWYGQDVCSYTGVICARAPDDPSIQTVAGIDLNRGNILGPLPESLGLLNDLAFFHINSNRFFGTLPTSFNKLRHLIELDVSNNKLEGPFPSVILSLPKLKFLDIRFNGFYGDVPWKLFNLKLDAIFINDNKFEFSLPENLGNSPASVLVLANNNLNGCLPSSLSEMSETLQEIMLLNTGLTGCLPSEIGSLMKLTVFDVSSNNLMGSLPDEIGSMRRLEQFSVANNSLQGDIPANICDLPTLKNLTYSNNYFDGEAPSCLKLRNIDDRKNCIPNRPFQWSEKKCDAFLSQPVSCAC